MKTYTETRSFDRDPYFPVCGFTRGWRRFDDTGKIDLCADEMNRFFNIPQAVDKIDVVLSNRFVAGSYKLTFNEKGNPGPVGGRIKLAGYCTPTLREHDTIVRAFLKRTGKKSCYVFVEYDISEAAAKEVYDA